MSSFKNDAFRKCEKKFDDSVHLWNEKHAYDHKFLTSRFETTKLLGAEWNSLLWRQNAQIPKI